MIPARAHFIWFGTQFPYAYVLALASAASRGEFDEIVLHHSDDLSSSEHWDLLKSLPGFTSRRLDPAREVEACRTVAPRLGEIFDRLEAPAAMANVMRVTILWREGGVYLDTDTLTVRSLRPLLSHSAFFGREHILYPQRHVHRTSRLHRYRRHALGLLRERAGAASDGYRWFRHFAWLYPKAANNAVIGCEPGHPLVTEMLRCMNAMPPEEQTVQYALGTHLLQRVVAGEHGGDAVGMAPEVFFPLPPGVSAHWFHEYDDIDDRIDDVIRPETRVVHWYASQATRTFVRHATPEFVQERAKSQLLCAAAVRALA